MILGKHLKYAFMASALAAYADGAKDQEKRRGLRNRKNRGYTQNSKLIVDDLRICSS
jgi:hypothetical protein